ncbi:MAG: hypothetical protein R2882_15170 [Gemmatimonadales bacterium]
MIGQGLADAARLKVGGRFVLTAQGVGGVAGNSFEVTGIFRTGIRGSGRRPRRAAARHRKRLARHARSGDRAVLLHDAREGTIGGPAARRRAAAPAAVFTWRETGPELDAAVRVDDLGNYLFNAVLLALVALAVLEALWYRCSTEPGSSACSGRWA